MIMMYTCRLNQLPVIFSSLAVHQLRGLYVYMICELDVLVIDIFQVCKASCTDNKLCIRNDKSVSQDAFMHAPALQSWPCSASSSAIIIMRPQMGNLHACGKLVKG